MHFVHSLKKFSKQYDKQHAFHIESHNSTFYWKLWHFMTWTFFNVHLEVWCWFKQLYKKWEIILYNFFFIFFWWCEELTLNNWTHLSSHLTPAETTGETVPVLLKNRKALKPEDRKSDKDKNKRKRARHTRWKEFMTEKIPSSKVQATSFLIGQVREIILV